MNGDEADLGFTTDKDSFEEIGTTETADLTD
jgi:hypothetical protein